MRFMLGIDVGGTFTDFVSYDHQTSSVEVWKVPSVPGDPVGGVLDGLDDFPHRAALSNLRLGTTVATNAILERKGATIAYITTHGFRDVVFIQRGNRKYHYDMSWVKPKPLVKRRHCYEVSERMDAYGNVVVPLDEAEVADIARQIRALPEIGAVAVCLLFSYLNPAHEQRIKSILAAALPEMPVSISYEVLPKWKEYERASTTIADAYLKPVVTRQLRGMRGRMDEAGLTAHTVVIKSNGGEMTLDAAANAPVNMVMSGPTGGVIASREVAGLVGGWLTVKELYGKVSSSKDANVHFQAGDRIRLATPGGGGYGDPGRRDPERVREDVREAYVSTEAAAREYRLARMRFEKSCPWHAACIIRWSLGRGLTDDSGERGEHPSHDAETAQHWYGRLARTSGGEWAYAAGCAEGGGRRGFCRPSGRACARACRRRSRSGGRCRDDQHRILGARRRALGISATRRLSAVPEEIPGHSCPVRNRTNCRHAGEDGGRHGRALEPLRRHPRRL